MCLIQSRIHWLSSDPAMPAWDSLAWEGVGYKSGETRQVACRWKGIKPPLFAGLWCAANSFMRRKKKWCLVLDQRFGFGRLLNTSVFQLIEASAYNNTSAYRDLKTKQNQKLWKNSNSTPLHIHLGTHLLIQPRTGTIRWFLLACGSSFYLHTAIYYFIFWFKSRYLSWKQDAWLLKSRQVKALEAFTAHDKLPDAVTSQEGSNARQNNIGG